MGYGYLLPPHQGNDPVQDEVDRLRRERPHTANANQQQNQHAQPDGRFLPPGGLSRKARQMHARNGNGQNSTAPTLTAERVIEQDLVPGEPAPILPPAMNVDAVLRYAPSPDPQPTVTTGTPTLSIPAPPASVSPTPTPLAPLSGPCTEGVFIRVQQHRMLLDCTLQGPHPNQPHMAPLVPIEAGDSVFVGWWHQGE